ncbi:uncharacterized protein LAJ45_03879 [Morchella importuna]|uniref:uncharacterized protein n=1 Tax=Morchella importuna TaxID=1174673 RepID=UPI001E8E1A65|nr:uncharacterized protein LAJ45_03879 [Morchella importuna]KAH8151886.1 hypothetical protein LAJ45_03879 [Morchella importuna]
MQLPNFLTILAIALPVSMAASLQRRDLECSDPAHPCNTYNNYPDCSPDYVKTLKACQVTGCIQWFRDPLEHCTKCDAPDNACNTYTNYKECSPEYIADVKECQYNGCINWIRDPLEDCY